MFATFAHVLYNFNILTSIITEYYTVQIYHKLLMHYIPDGHEEHAHLLSLVISGALNLVLYHFWCLQVRISTGYTPKSGNLGSKGTKVILPVFKIEYVCSHSDYPCINLNHINEMSTMSKVTNYSRVLHSYKQNDESVHPVYLGKSGNSENDYTICFPLCRVNHKHWYF